MIVMCNVCKHAWLGEKRSIERIRCPLCGSNKSLSIRSMGCEQCNPDDKGCVFCGTNMASEGGE